MMIIIIIIIIIMIHTYMYAWIHTHTSISLNPKYNAFCGTNIKTMKIHSSILIKHSNSTFMKGHTITAAFAFTD